MPTQIPHSTAGSPSGRRVIGSGSSIISFLSRLTAVDLSGFSIMLSKNSAQALASAPLSTDNLLLSACFEVFVPTDLLLLADVTAISEFLRIIAMNCPSPGDR